MSKYIDLLIHNGWFYITEHDPEDLLGLIKRSKLRTCNIDAHLGYSKDKLGAYLRGTNRIKPEVYKIYINALKKGVPAPERKTYTPKKLKAVKIVEALKILKPPRKLTEKQRRRIRARKLFVDNFILEWKYQECVG